MHEKVLHIQQLLTIWPILISESVITLCACAKFPPMPEKIVTNRDPLIRKGNSSTRQNHSFLLQFWVILSFIPREVIHVYAAYQKSYFNPNLLMERCILWTFSKNDGHCELHGHCGPSLSYCADSTGHVPCPGYRMPVLQNIAARRRIQHEWFSARNEMIYLLLGYRSILISQIYTLVYTCHHFIRSDLSGFVQSREKLRFFAMSFLPALSLDWEKRNFVRDELQLV